MKKRVTRIYRGVVSYTKELTGRVKKLTKTRYLFASPVVTEEATVGSEMIDTLDKDGAKMTI